MPAPFLEEQSQAEAVQAAKEAARLRQRRRRARLREGTLRVTIDVSRELLDVLVEVGRLAAWDEQDAAAVQAAVQQHLDSTRVGTVTA